MAGNLDYGSGATDPEEERRRMEAMQRALATAEPVGPTGPQAPRPGDTYQTAYAPAPQGAPGDASLAQGESYDQRPDSVKYAAGPMGPEGPDSAMARAAAAAKAQTGGSLSQPTGGLTADQAAQGAALAAAANASNPNLNPRPNGTVTGGGTTTDGGTTGGGTGGPGGGTGTGTGITTTPGFDASVLTKSTYGGDATGNATGTDAGITDQNTGGPGGAGPGGSGSAGGSLGQITNQIMSQLSSIGQSLSAPGTPSDVTGVFLTQAQSILSLLDSQEAQLRSENEKAGTSVDPATQFTIDQLRKTLEDNLKTTREDLNRRGLYDSGIEIEAEGKLKTGSASDQARILAERLSGLQQQLQQGLSSIRSQKVSTLGQFGLNAANAQFTHGENDTRNALDRDQAALQGMLNLRGQLGNEQDNANSIRANSSESALDRAFRASQSEADRAFTGSQNALERDSAMSRALASARTTGSTASAPAQINNPYGGQTKTPGVDAGATNAAIAAVNGAGSREQAQADLFKSAQQLIDQGVDITQVQDAIDQRFAPDLGRAGRSGTVGGPI